MHQPRSRTSHLSVGSRPRSRPKRLGALAAGLAVVVLTAGACGSSGGATSSSSVPESSSASGAGGGDTSSSVPKSSAGGAAGSGGGGGVTIAGHTVTMDAAVAATVPASIRQKGALVDITYNNVPPDAAVVDGKLVGWEVEIGQAVATVLGLEWQPTASGAFDSFIPGLQNGRYNVSFTSLIQTPDRLKQIDVVTFFNVGTGFAVKKGSSISIKAPTDVCGHSVAVISGSAFIDQLKGIDCAGKAKIDVQSFPSDSASELAVSSGRAEIYATSSNQLAYLIKQTNGQFEQQPLDYMPVAEGAGVTKGSGLSKPIADAVDVLIKNGTYAAIMKKWSITSGLVEKASVYSK